MNYKVISLQDHYDLFESQNRIVEEAWPEFMLHDAVLIKYWMQLIEAFKEYQLLIMDGTEIVAIINTVPLHVDQDSSRLPDEGVDWGIEKSIADYTNNIKPNSLLGTQIVVNRKHQGKGLSSLSVREMSKLASRKGFEHLLTPVRPSNKHLYPLIPIGDYLNWENDDKQPFDGWLRVHSRAGGKIVNVCSKSMTISGTIDEWKAWTKLKFPGSGLYIIPGALNPVSIDIEKDEGIYIEPNVWVMHETNKNLHNGS